VIIMFSVFALAGCQHRPTSDLEKSARVWRVLERVGQARTVDDDGLGTILLRPGDLIEGDRQVVTDMSALAILAGDGVQLTLGENTSLRLAAPASSMTLDRGLLRVRLATAANREARIKTAHFGVSASNATLKLLARPGGTSLSVIAGTAVLATADGSHQATLAAGAEAKIEEQIGDDLFIRPASGQAFVKVAPLAAAPQARQHDQTQLEAKATTPRSMAEEPRSAKPAPTDAPAMRKNLAILPASQLKRPDAGQPAPSNPMKNVRHIPRPAPSQPEPTAPTARAARSQFEKDVIVPSIFDTGDSVRPTDPSVLRQTSAYDPLQLKFQQLTEGLVDGL